MATIGIIRNQDFHPNGRKPQEIEIEFLRREVAELRREVAALQALVLNRVKTTLHPNQRGGVTNDQIIRAVAEEFEIKAEHMKGRNNSHPIVEVRSIAMLLVRSINRLSYPNVAILFGGFHHTTVLTACRSAVTRIDESKELKERVTRIQNSLRELARFQ